MPKETCSLKTDRQQLHKRLFPDGIPVLWCPLLTHYTPDGAIDCSRMTAHLNHLSTRVKGYLVPGTTGDGWEMNDREIRQVLSIVVEQAASLRLHILIGVLKTDSQAARQAILETLDWLPRHTRLSGIAGQDHNQEHTDSTPPETASGQNNRANAGIHAPVCGFAVCPPRGKDLSQAEIGQGLAAILEMGLPMALYQLPQVTLNEMSPELVSHLAMRFSKFYLFKDTSGTDRVALARQAPEDVFLVRGAEGDYARWLAAAGGPYHGLLLSTANCFVAPLHQIIQDLKHGRLAEARAVSAQLTSAVKAVFGLVEGLPAGNAFANANKAMDHFFAYGPRALAGPPPRLHSGPSLPMAVIRATGEVLAQHGLLPDRGYLE